MKKSGWLLTLLLAIAIINYPNPFNPKGGETVTFECTPDTTTEALIYVYDMSARRVFQQTFNLQGGSVNRLTWNGYGSDNDLVGTGVYLYRLIDAGSKKSLGKGKVWVINR